MTDEIYTPYIAQSLIDDASTAHQTALARTTRTAADLEKARADHAQADAASIAAIAGEGDLSPLEAEHQLNDAATVLSVAGKVHTAAMTALAEADKARTTARGNAWKPVYREGIKRRLAAAEKADAARALMAEARRDYDTGTKFLNTATQHGTMDVISDPSHGAGAVGEVCSLEVETKRWASVPAGWWNALHEGA